LESFLAVEKRDRSICFGCSVAALIVSGVAEHIDDKQQKQIQAEKERLQKEAISKQAALIQALRDDAQMSRERQDYWSA
jgi:maleate cis-trans isomerase